MKLVRKLLKIFIDLRFAISILILISSIISIGTIIEQDQTTTYYINSYPLNNPPLGIISYQVIFFFGLDHIYRSWIFLSLITILSTSLILCTVNQQVPNLFQAKELKIFKLTQRILDCPLSYSAIINLQNNIFNNVLRFLYSSNFYIHQQKKSIYALNGLLGKGGPIIVHFSLICIFLGAFIGAFGGFNAQEFIPRGEIIRIQNLLSTGKFTTLPDLSIRLNDFWIEYTQQKINQFYSYISIISPKGIELFNNTISVNHPASFNNVVFYQTDWDILGLRIQKNNQLIFEYPLTLLNKNPKVWSSLIVSENGNLNFLIFDELRQIFKLYDQLGSFIQQLNFGDLFLNNYTVCDLVLETGFQIKFDPSIPLIFFGFGLLMLSTLLSYMSFSEIWLHINQQRLFLGGRTNRSKTNFEILFSKLTQLLAIKSS